MLEETEIRELIEELAGLTFIINGHDYLFDVVRSWSHIDLRKFVIGKERDVRKIVVENTPLELGGVDFVGYTIGYDENKLPVKGRLRYIEFKFTSMASDVSGIVDGRLLARGALEYIRPRIYSGELWEEKLEEHIASVYPAREGNIIEVTKVLNLEYIYAFQMVIIIRDVFVWTSNPDARENNPFAQSIEFKIRTPQTPYLDGRVSL